MGRGGMCHSGPGLAIQVRQPKVKQLLSICLRSALKGRSGQRIFCPLHIVFNFSGLSLNDKLDGWKQRLDGFAAQLTLKLFV